jgi:hypothetical protein
MPVTSEIDFAQKPQHLLFGSEFANAAAFSRPGLRKKVAAVEIQPLQRLPWMPEITISFPASALQTVHLISLITFTLGG